MILRSSKIDRKQVHYTTFLNECAKKLDLASRAGMTPLLTGKTVVSWKCDIKEARRKITYKNVVITGLSDRKTVVLHIRRYQGTQAYPSRRLNSCLGHTYAPVYNLKFQLKLSRFFMITSYQNFIGIDIGKLEFVIAVNEQKGVIKFDNNCAGWKQFYQKFSDILPNSMVILEATGGYELGLLYFLIDRNIAVHRANTRQVKNFILSHGTLAKTDNLDAKALAQYGSERYRHLQLFTLISKEQTTLFALCQRRDDITKMLVQEKNRLKTPENNYIKESCQHTIEFLNNQVKNLDQAIQKIVNENPELQRCQKILETVPGIGRKTSQCLLCLIPELGSLNKKQVASLAGVAPHPKESGKAIGYRKITGGRSNVRSKLFTAAMAARNSKSELAAFYCKLVDNDKRKMVALTALMRKIIVIANARLKEAINLNI